MRCSRRLGTSSSVGFDRTASGRDRSSAAGRCRRACTCLAFSTISRKGVSRELNVAWPEPGPLLLAIVYSALPEVEIDDLASALIQCQRQHLALERARGPTNRGQTLASINAGLAAERVAEKPLGGRDEGLVERGGADLDAARQRDCDLAFLLEQPAWVQ
jgi:hypothetical protein